MSRKTAAYVPLILALALVWRTGVVRAQGPEGSAPSLTTGAEVYQASCAACHGPDGRGRPQAEVGFETPLPDFTDCSYASREHSADWATIAHSGGPVRVFSQIMPAFGEALTTEQIEAAVEHIRGFCTDSSWPRGELNLPLPLVTEKAFPEDEALIEASFSAEGPVSFSPALIYEKRFGAQNQIELKVPFQLDHPDGQEWSGGIGDIGFAFKRPLFHSVDTGSIFSVVVEVVLPTGDPDRGTGKGVTIFEPYGAFGQILPGNSFVQLQGGAELPTHKDDAVNELYWRTAIGKTFAQDSGRGRSWTPMIEVLGARELETGAEAEWDLVPQMQVSLSKRQHIMANVGVRLPVTQTGSRTTEVLVYVLWDWFDGGLFEGWR